MHSKTLTLTRSKPLDFPFKNRPFRIYAALTNSCNRACPWCSACSSLAGKTFLSIPNFKKHIPLNGDFEVQFEGGEPFMHPDFWKFISIALENEKCRKIVVVTNGTTIPRDEVKLRKWFHKFGEAFTLKLSINHYLLERDRRLINLAALLQKKISQLKGDRELVLNVRLRKNNEHDIQKILKEIEATGLTPHSNIFYLQRYGFAKDEESWDEPYIVEDNFTLLNPDGKAFNTNIIARSEAMRNLP